MICIPGQALLESELDRRCKAYWRGMYQMPHCLNTCTSSGAVKLNLFLHITGQEMRDDELDRQCKAYLKARFEGSWHVHHKPVTRFFLCSRGAHEKRAGSVYTTQNMLQCRLLKPLWSRILSHMLQAEH